MSILREIRINIDPTPAEMAKVFANYDENEQAMFFEELAKQVKQWDKHFCFQVQAISDSEKLTYNGRRIMQIIGEYGQQII